MNEMSYSYQFNIPEQVFWCFFNWIPSMAMLIVLMATAEIAIIAIMAILAIIAIANCNNYINEEYPSYVKKKKIFCHLHAML